MDALIVYPDVGNAFYGDLARRLESAVDALGDSRARLLPFSDLLVHPEHASGKDLLLVNPRECIEASHARAFPDVSSARRRLLVLAESLSTRWFKGQFSTGVAFDALIDVGFMRQTESGHVDGLPYAFVFNGATSDERARIEDARPIGGRVIPWSVIGHHTPDRAQLVSELAATMGTAGFVFLPSLRPVRPGEGLLSPTAVHRILGESDFYVWLSHHRWPYFESFRFVDALVSGAVPCKISAHGAVFDGIPSVYSSVSELADAAESIGAATLYEQAREFYLGAGALSDHLSRALSTIA